MIAFAFARSHCPRTARNPKIMSDHMKCPNCGLINPINTQQCECGHDFSTEISPSSNQNIDRTVPAYFDFSSNLPTGAKGMEQEAQNVVNILKQNANDIVGRSLKVKPFMTFEVGDWASLYKQAKDAFSMGYFHSTISLVGMMSEAFCRQLYQKIIIKKLDGNECNNKLLFGEETRIRQERRINILKELLVIDDHVYNKLIYININRNKVVHNISKEVSEDETLKVLNSFIEVLSHRFDKLHKINDGKVVRK